MTRKEQAAALAAKLAPMGIYAMYGGTKGHGFWLMKSKVAGDAADIAIRAGKGFDWLLGEARAAGQGSGLDAIENDGKRSGNPYFTMFSDAAKLAA